ncbi:MAG: chloride channel protein, partial [Lutimonas sp.]
MDSKVALTKFLRWRYKYFTQSQFRNIVSAIIGLLAGLAAVTLKNLTHFIQVLLEGKFIFEFHKAFYFVFPI